MSDDIRPSDREIESITRMTRESSDFYKGLAIALDPRESREPSGAAISAQSVEH